MEEDNTPAVNHTHQGNVNLDVVSDGVTGREVVVETVAVVDP
jgi:hypothetical protein